MLGDHAGRSRGRAHFKAFLGQRPREAVGVAVVEVMDHVPLVGQILGNGRDRGLIGVTFRLAGNANSPTLQINPLSVIAPGIFRSIFEFH